MRQGIHLGEPREVRPRGRWLRVAGALLLVGSLYHGWSLSRTISETRETSTQLDTLKSAIAERAPLSDDETTRLMTKAYPWLDLLSEAEAAQAPVGSEILTLISDSLPEGIRLQALSLQRSGEEPVLTLSAIGRDSPTIAAWQSALERDNAIDRTELLEERVGASGELSLRLRVQLAPRSF